MQGAGSVPPRFLDVPDFRETGQNGVRPLHSCCQRAASHLPAGRRGRRPLQECVGAGPLAGPFVRNFDLCYEWIPHQEFPRVHAQTLKHAS